MKIEYITLAIYLGILLMLGVVFSRFNKNLSDFVRGGAQGTWWMVGTSMLMSGISAFTFTGNASAAFEAGPSLLVIYIANCLGYVVGGLFLGRWLRQTRAYTTADVVRVRYGVPVEQFAAFTEVFLGPVGAAIQLYALSLFASTVLGLPLLPVLVTIGVIVIFYSTTGGKWAVMAADFVQALVMFSITLLVFVLSLRAIGGLGPFFNYFSDPHFAQDFRFFNDAGRFPGGSVHVPVGGDCVFYAVVRAGQPEFNRALYFHARWAGSLAGVVVGLFTDGAGQRRLVRSTHGGSLPF